MNFFSTWYSYSLDSEKKNKNLGKRKQDETSVAETQTTAKKPKIVPEATSSVSKKGTDADFLKHRDNLGYPVTLYCHNTLLVYELALL